MKFFTKIILGVFSFIALCLVYYSDNYFSQKKEERKQELSKALFFNPADTIQFTLKNKNGNFVFKRLNNDSEWKMLEPQALNADQESVSNTLTAVSQISVQQELAQQNSKDFGLDNPAISISVTLNNQKIETLKVGNNIDIGSKISGKLNSLAVYGLNVHRPQVLVLDAMNINTLQDKDFFDFRTKRVATFAQKEVSAISINSKDESISLKKIQGNWNLLALQNKPADENFILRFLQTYQSLTVRNVVEKNEVLKTGLQKYDLLKPAANIQFMDEHGKILQKIELGITKSAIYVRMPDGAVGQLDLAAWPDYVPRAAKFLKQDKSVEHNNK